MPRAFPGAEEKRVNDSIRHVYLIGAKGIGGYGGFETFVKKLVEYQPPDSPVRLHIACKAGGYGASDAHKLPGVRFVDQRRFVWRGAEGNLLPVIPLGHMQAILYDLYSVFWALRAVRRDRVEKPVFYILSCKLGPVIGLLARRMHAVGGRFYLNPDGHEWLRAKWSRPVRAYLKYSEARMIRCADKVVCDAKAIEDYVHANYGLDSQRTCCIAYGAEVKAAPDPGAEAACRRWLAERGLAPDGYYLMISRFIPENSFELILREFLASETPRRLVIISDENEPYRRALDSRLGVSESGRVLFAGPCYDEPLLCALRANARAYLHGHTVGGTNPGLLEALAGARLCLVRDVVFNREVASDAALYWDAEPGSLARRIEEADAMESADLSDWAARGKQRIAEAYQWPAVVKSYEEIFLEN